jgi:predicted neuraminidase
MLAEQEFVFESAPFKECHAASIEENADGELLATWFGGTKEGADDVGIWLSRKTGGAWSQPEEVAREEGVPCWNPVLFRAPSGMIWLFYKVGVNPRSWSGAYLTSDDGGASWSEPVMLPAGLLGPIKNKPVLLSNGRVLMPSSVESYRAWTGWVESMDDDGGDWQRRGPIVLPGTNFGLIQPTLVEIAPGRVRAFLRATRAIGRICCADSEDYGVTWSRATRTELPNPNSGIDAVGLENCGIVMVYNHTTKGRSPLNVAISTDGGRSWGDHRALEDEPGEYSYPAVIQSRDGTIHTAYTYRRRTIKHVCFRREWLGESE